MESKLIVVIAINLGMENFLEATIEESIMLKINPIQIVLESVRIRERKAKILRKFDFSIHWYRGNSIKRETP